MIGCQGDWRERESDVVSRGAGIVGAIRYFLKKLVKMIAKD